MIKVSFYGNPYIGIYGKVNNEFAVLPEDTHPTFERAVRERLGVEVVKTSISGSDLIGVYSVMNSNAMLVPKIAYKDEIKKIERETGISVHVIETRNVALGNAICCNDHGAIVSPAMEKSNVKIIENALDVEAVQANVAGYPTVGSACVATNKGFIAHNNTDQKELKKIGKYLGCDGINGTVNFGFPFPAYGILANSKGYIVGEKTTGIEVMRIEQGLGFTKKVIK